MADITEKPAAKVNPTALTMAAMKGDAASVLAALAQGADGPCRGRQCVARRHIERPHRCG